MKPTIYLSCLVVIIGSLVWTASAEQASKSEKLRVIWLLENVDVDSISDSSLVFLVKFFKLNLMDINWTSEELSRFEAYVKTLPSIKKNVESLGLEV